MKKITHLSIYQIEKDGLFDKINSYSEMNENIKLYGEMEPTEYKNRVAMPFEIFTMFFSDRYGDTPLLGIKNVVDTSDDPFNAGYDFSFIDLYDKKGQIQSKWKSNTMYQFTLGDLATNSAIAADNDIEKNNNILFINFDDGEDLFHYSYKTARNKRRVIDRRTQEEFILRDPDFWNDFRACIKISAKNFFENPYKPRDVQDWILNGHKKYEGTISVLNGKYTKGRVEATTATGKTLCHYYNIMDWFNVYNKNIAVMIMPSLALIDQTFKFFYKFKMFGGDTENSNISCLIIRSGTKPRYNDQIASVLQTLDINEAIGYILSETAKNRKVVIFITMKSHDLKYSDINSSILEKGINKGNILEIVDEYHNIISTSSIREKQIEISNYLENNTDRCAGTIFYSASSKDGQILSSFKEEQFGILLAKIVRNDLRIRAFVCPKLVVKLVKVKSISSSSEDKREAIRSEIDLDKAQSEAVGIISAYKDLKKYYDNPNLLTFGSSVEGCRFIAFNEQIKKYLPDVNHYFMASETSNSDRENIFVDIENSGNNILHQHSVAKEGVNIPNLHGIIVGRGLSIISTQQGIGRSDRALMEDTKNFQNKKLKLTSPEGWKKYYNVIYVIVDDEDETFYKRLKEIIRYLKDSGIPENEWDISYVEDDERGGIKEELPDFFPSIVGQISIDDNKFKKMLEMVKIEIEEDEFKVADKFESNRLNSMSKIEILKEKLLIK